MAIRKDNQVVAEFLTKWCDPKPEFSGVMAHTLAGYLLKELEEAKIARDAGMAKCDRENNAVMDMDDDSDSED